MTSKVCSLCHTKKGLHDFHVHARGLHGRESRCKKCVGVRKGRRKGRPRRRQTPEYTFKANAVGLPSPDAFRAVAFGLAEVLKGVLDDEGF